MPRNLIRHINEWVCVVKQCKVGGNGLFVHLAWPLDLTLEYQTKVTGIRCPLAVVQKADRFSLLIKKKKKVKSSVCN